MAKKKEYSKKKFNGAILPSELQWMVDNPKDLQRQLCNRVADRWDEMYNCCRNENIKCDDCILDRKHILEFKEWITPATDSIDKSDKRK